MRDLTPARPTVARLHPISRRRLETLTGELGIFQHAIGSTPDGAHGHRVDDVARALQVDLLHARSLGWNAVADSARRSLQFLEDAFEEPSGRFRTFRSIDGSWIEGPVSNDSLGRTMLALGETIAAAPEAAVVDVAMALFGRALPAARKVTSPRAQASVILGCAAVAGSATLRDPTLGVAATAVMRTMATGLHAQFLWLARPGWPWLEETLTCENALIPRALIVAGRHLGALAMLAIGRQVLDWLIGIETAPEGHLSPIGNAGWPRLGAAKSQFDQQPIEATALLLAAEAAHGVTGEPRYLAAMERAYAWFLGANDLGLRVAHPTRGAASDGLTAAGINTNEGPESTLMWLMAAEHIRAVRGQPSRVAAAPRASRAIIAAATAPSP